jgi:hypothetical protein
MKGLLLSRFAPSALFQSLRWVCAQRKQAKHRQRNSAAMLRRQRLCARWFPQTAWNAMDH